MADWKITVNANFSSLSLFSHRLVTQKLDSSYGWGQAKYCFLSVKRGGSSYEMGRPMGGNLRYTMFEKMCIEHQYTICSYFQKKKLAQCQNNNPCG